MTVTLVLMRINSCLSERYPQPSTVLFPAKGFIHVRPVESTIKVRSGESLSLVVNMEAYPKPNHFTWNFMGQALANTTDHVITTDNHSHR